MLSCKQHESFIPRDDRLSLEAEAAPQIGRVRSRQFFGDLRRTFMAMTDSVRRLMPKVDSRAAPDGRLTRGGAVRASDGDSRDQTSWVSTSSEVGLIFSLDLPRYLEESTFVFSTTIFSIGIQIRSRMRRGDWMFSE